MSILVDSRTRLLVQGITGNQGSFHTRLMLDYGTKVVAGVVPGRGGELVHKVPVFHTVREAVDTTQPNCGIIFVPASGAPDAILEQVAAQIPLIVCITEGIPVIDMIRVYHRVREAGVQLIGPNCPGLISPAGKVKIGILPGGIHMPGPVGVVSRSGTLTYEVVQSLSELKLGQSTCVGIGGDPIIGMAFTDIVALFEQDKSTEAIVLIGEIGGNEEERCAQYIAHHVSKPVIGFIAGRTAPPEKRMGHAGAIVSGGAGTASAKIAALQDAGATIVNIPSDIASAVRSQLG